MTGGDNKIEICRVCIENRMGLLPVSFLSRGFLSGIRLQA